jgi:hypothetical protein
VRESLEDLHAENRALRRLLAICLDAYEENGDDDQRGYRFTVTQAWMDTVTKIVEQSEQAAHQELLELRNLQKWKPSITPEALK